MCPINTQKSEVGKDQVGYFNWRASFTTLEFLHVYLEENFHAVTSYIKWRWNGEFGQVLFQTQLDTVTKSEI